MISLNRAVLRRIQIVWWPWRFGLPHFHSWAGRGALSDILDYSLVFYPLEIRVWKVDMPVPRPPIIEPWPCLNGDYCLEPQKCKELGCCNERFGDRT